MDRRGLEMPTRRAIGISDQEETLARAQAERNLSTNSHLFHPTTTDSTMLRLTILAARPLGLSKSAAVTLRPVARNFSSFGSKTTTNYFNAASNRSRASPSSFWSKCSRTFMTDSSAVTARPTQAEAWKKYAVTAVRHHRIQLSEQR